MSSLPPVRDGRLIGGRDRATGRVTFPCPDDPAFEPVALPSDGRIWSWTVQRFRPKSPPYAGPEAFAPYAVAYVELPGACIVETPLADADIATLRVGQPVRLTTHGLGAHTPFAFTPAAAA